MPFHDPGLPPPQEAERLGGHALLQQQEELGVEEAIGTCLRTVGESFVGAKHEQVRVQRRWPASLAAAGLGGPALARHSRFKAAASS